MAARAQSILVGFDGSEAAHRALDAAASLVGYGSTLAVASVSAEGRPAPRSTARRGTAPAAQATGAGVVPRADR